MSKTYVNFCTAALGLVLLGAWVGLCSFAFWWLLSATPEGVTSAAVQALAWPFAVILVALPILAIALLGGLEMLRQVVSLRAFLEELPSELTKLDGVAKRFESSRDLISDAAAAIDQTTSQLADVEARVKRLSPERGIIQPGPTQDIDIVASLSQHLENAKSLFDAAAEKYEADNKQAVTRARGWILSESVNELRSKGYLNQAAGEYVEAALEVDRRTRRSGRTNLAQLDIERLDRLKP